MHIIEVEIDRGALNQSLEKSERILLRFDRILNFVPGIGALILHYRLAPSHHGFARCNHSHRPGRIGVQKAWLLVQERKNFAQGVGAVLAVRNKRRPHFIHLQLFAGGQQAGFVFRNGSPGASIIRGNPKGRAKQYGGDKGHLKFSVGQLHQIVPETIMDLPDWLDWSGA